MFEPSLERLEFLSSENARYTYANLYSFTVKIFQITENYTFTDTSPLLIHAPSSEKLVFLLSAAFLLKIPVMVLHHDTTEQELESVLQQVSAKVIYSEFNYNSERLSNLDKIDIPDSFLTEEESWKPDLFSLSGPESVAGLFLTSGSTGTPKIVPVKRRQIFVAANSSAQNFKPGKNKYWLLCLPLNHVGGINVIYRSILYQSGIYLTHSFDEVKIRELLYSNKNFEVASMVPTMLEQLMEDKFFRVHFGFKAILLGGGPISVQFIDKAITRGLPIVTSYGMTETCAQIAANPLLQPSGAYIPKTSVGKPFSPNKVEIRDENGKNVSVNESGQVWLKGPQVFDGYLDENLNKNAFDDKEWFNTGDFGHLNRKGHLFIESRRTDLIITGGENVSPAEVESALNRCKDVSEAGVIGVPDKKWGQKVVAYFVPSNNSFDVNGIKQELKSTLKGFQTPKEFIPIAKLPKTDTLKVQRKKLIDRYFSD